MHTTTTSISNLRPPRTPPPTTSNSTSNSQVGQPEPRRLALATDPFHNEAVLTANMTSTGLAIFRQCDSVPDALFDGIYFEPISLLFSACAVVILVVRLTTTSLLPPLAPREKKGAATAAAAAAAARQRRNHHRRPPPPPIQPYPHSVHATATTYDATCHPPLFVTLLCAHAYRP